ncbi:MAG TPA: methylmalonyl Co-A mutase-associated GTPase MeaB [Kofleriaceae bacterium]|nr:methylmalonyl Co-A mutase-associated GTPase MeaB [Kofleriaceae bacterium]
MTGVTGVTGVTGGDAAPGARARADAILAGDLRTAARLMRDLDDRRPDAIAALKQLFPHTGRAYIIGVTGNPGAGKSTLVDALIAHYRAAGERVGVVCVDPTSPFSGGAILGDRVRMQRHALDPGVFIRSLATRGHLGGLSRSTFDVVHVLDAMGFSRILIETVGVGQDEIDVMRAAHTTVVVAVPGLGDAIQAIKSGLLEIADVLAVNKADRDGAARTERDLRHMLELRAADGRRQVDIIRTIATRGTAAGSRAGAGAGAGARAGSGIVELAAAIEAHRARIAASPDAAGRAQARACAQLTDLVRALLADRAARALEAHGGLAEFASAVAQHRADPWTLAEQLIDAL